VGFGQDHCAGDSGRFAGLIPELVEIAPDHGEPVAPAGVDAESLQPGGVQKDAGGAAAVVEIGDQVEAVHDGILFRFT
jgi:hypothetical protein